MTELFVPAGAVFEPRASWNEQPLLVQSLYFPPQSAPPPRQPLPMAHYHRDIELIYVLAGEVTGVVGGKAYPLGGGDLLLIRGGSPHTFQSSEDRAYVCIKVVPELLYGDDPSLVPLRHRLSRLFDDHGGCCIPAAALDRTATDTVFWSLVREGAAKQTGFQLVMRGEVLRLFGWLLRQTDAPPEVELPRHTAALIRRAMDYTERHLNTVTLPEVAAHCGVSYSYFSGLFRRAMNKGFNPYVNGLRIEEAARRLTETEESVEEIAYAVGFGSASYFIARFKAVKGLSPHRFRKGSAKNHA